jgi:hypothetical protein
MVSSIHPFSYTQFFSVRGSGIAADIRISEEASCIEGRRYGRFFSSYLFRYHLGMLCTSLPRSVMLTGFF